MLNFGYVLDNLLNLDLPLRGQRIQVLDNLCHGTMTTVVHLGVVVYRQRVSGNQASWFLGLVASGFWA